VLLTTSKHTILGANPSKGYWWC